MKIKAENWNSWNSKWFLRIEGQRQKNDNGNNKIIFFFILATSRLPTLMLQFSQIGRRGRGDNWFWENSNHQKNKELRNILIWFPIPKDLLLICERRSLTMTCNWATFISNNSFRCSLFWRPSPKPGIPTCKNYFKVFSQCYKTKILGKNAMKISDPKVNNKSKTKFCSHQRESLVSILWF